MYERVRACVCVVCVWGGGGASVFVNPYDVHVYCNWFALYVLTRFFPLFSASADINAYSSSRTVIQSVCLVDVNACPLAGCWYVH